MNNPHKNARTCLYSREQIVERHQNGQRAGDIASAFGISVRTVYKWLKRYREGGEAGLENRSSKPHSFPRAFIAGFDNIIDSLS